MAGKRCVVIDDSSLVLAMARDALEKAGYEVQATDSGIEANQYIFSTPPPDVIIVDVMMPMLSGDQKVRLLKEREKSRHIPILLMSSKTEAELQQLAEDSGANGFIRKPFAGEELVAAVTRAIRR